MTATQIKADVDRGLALSAEIKRLQGELKTIEKRLNEAALEGITEPLHDDTREGRQYIAQGTAARLPVIIESDQIIASFPAHGATASELLTLCGDDLDPLYRSVTKYERVPKDGKAFRAAAHERFGADRGSKIIAAAIQRDKSGIPRSRIIIPWDRAKEAV